MMRSFLMRENMMLEFLKVDYSVGSNETGLVFKTFLFDNKGNKGDVYANYEDISAMDKEFSVCETPYRAVSYVKVDNPESDNDSYSFMFVPSDKDGNTLSLETLYAPQVVLGKNYIPDKSVFDMVIEGYLRKWGEQLKESNVTPEDNGEES